MAIYSFNRKITKRTGPDGNIRNSVFAAAYYRAEKRTCHKTNETKDFSKKQSEVIYKNSILPKDAPAWALKLRNAQTLGEDGKYSYDQTGVVFSEYAWNLIENIEKRYDSQIYTRDIIAIPIELNQEQAISLAREFAEKVLAVDGLFCEVAVHWDLVNPHIHYMRPAFRAMTEEGFSNKIRPTQAELRASLLDHRELWAEYANRKLLACGYDVKIDHRSYKDRGIDLIPTVKIGKAVHMHRTEHQELRTAENQQIRALNFQNINANPEIINKKIAQERQEFVSADVHHEVSRYVVNPNVLEKIRQDNDLSNEKITKSIIETLKSEHSIFNERMLKAEVLKTIDDDQGYQEIIRRVLASDDVFKLGLGEDGREHYITKEAFKLELESIESAKSLSEKSSFLVSPDTVANGIKKYDLNKSQILSLKNITQGKNIAIVRGMAGTGKTYLLKPAKEIWKDAGYRVHGVAFLGRVAAGLQSDSGIKSKTIDRFLNGVKQGGIKIGNKDIIAMDETGMTSLDHMHSMLQLVKAAGAKLVLVGDIEQTQSTRRGATLRAMIDTVGCTVLDDIIRQKVEWQRDATLMMETQQTKEAVDLYHANGKVHLVDTSKEAISLTVQKWFDQVSLDQDVAGNLKNHVMTAYKNETVFALNTIAREKLITSEKIQEGDVFKVASGEIKITIGERIVFGKNDTRLDVKNGDFGVVTDIKDRQLTVQLDSGQLKEFYLSHYNDISYGYAATIHKLQGYTGNDASLYVDSRGFDRHLFLVGASRHRFDLSIIADKEIFNDLTHLKEVVSRDGLKDHIYDFPAAYAIRRGFDENSITQRAANVIRKTKEKIQDSTAWLFNYQDSIGDKEKNNGFHETTKRRQEAVVVADFCDRRVEVAQRIEAIQAMPGFSLSVNYQIKPDDSEILDKKLYLYLEEESVYFAAKNDLGDIERIAVNENQFISDKILKSIKNTLLDDAQIENLSAANKEAFYKVAVQHGFDQINEDKKIELQREIYALQLKNSEFAKTIRENFNQVKVAMDRNRITRDAVEKSVAFGERHHEIKSIAKKFNLKQFYDPIISNKVVTDLSLYYGHIISAVGADKPLNMFINELKYQAHNYRYDTAFEVFGVEKRSEIKSIKHYLDLDYEITKILIDKENAPADIKERLYGISIKRNEVAHQILHDTQKYEAVAEHFGANKKRLFSHQVAHLARNTVKQFSELNSIHNESQNLSKQYLAHKIKSRMRRYGVYIDEFLPDGFKQVNLENYRYERRLEIGKKSVEFKESNYLVRRYFEAASSAGASWKSALKRKEKQSSNTDHYIKIAQAFSYQRDKLASQIIRDIEKHAGAVAFNKVDLERLSFQARSYNYFQNYVREENDIKKMYKAHYMSENMRAFSHGISLHNLGQEIREKSKHFSYLKIVKKLPDQETKQMIRLLETYEKKRFDAGQAWRVHKSLEKNKQHNDYTFYVAKHLANQRNTAAYILMKHCAKSNLIDLKITGIKIDAVIVEKHAKQHIANQRILDYLNVNSNDRGRLAQEILLDRSSYHLIYASKIEFKTLNQEARNYLDSQSESIKTVVEYKTEISAKKHFDFELISSRLMSNPEETYTAIFGEPKKRTSKEWRYENGLVVTITGSNAGKWYCFTDNKGGGPIKALQEAKGLSFKDALIEGANLAGLSESQFMTTKSIEAFSNKSSGIDRQLNSDEIVVRNKRIESAKSIWQGTEIISGTLAERYFVEHRKVSSINNMEIRYWPQGKAWIDYSDGKEEKKINKIPAAVIGVRNASGELTGVQRIYLDAKTAGKNTFMSNAKLSKGIMQGSAGVIQIGKQGGRLYIAEGPETCASIALVDRDATVLASLGVNNLSSMSDVIKSYNPSEVILAADNDGAHSKTKATTENAFHQLTEKLQDTGINFKLIYPETITGKEKVDWNDVLIQKGEFGLKLELNSTVKESDLHYYTARSIEYTKAEHYLREVKGLIGVDLSEVRYHDALTLPDKTNKAPAILIPAINKKGDVSAELILYLDKVGENVIQTTINGNPKDAVIAIQKTKDAGSFYITDNFVDAKSITIGNKKANIYMSLDHYRDLKDISWILNQSERPFTQVILTTDNFEKTTEKSLFELSSPLRDKKLEVLMAKGRLSDDITHVTINEAMVRQKKIQGESFIQQIGVKEPLNEKQSFKEKIKSAIRSKPVEDKQKAVVKPEKQTPLKYYVTFDDKKTDAIKNYFDALVHFNSKNDYDSALNIAKTSNLAYEELFNDIRQINNHPQSPARIDAHSSIEMIRERVINKESLRLHDVDALLKSIATPKLDHKTQESILYISEKMSKGSYDKEYESSVKSFSEERLELIALITQAKSMPGTSNHLTLKDIQKMAQGEITRENFTAVTHFIKQDIASCFNNEMKKGVTIGNDDDRSRGGRSL